ncbi:MAG: DUF885 domain-containing protein, partial [Acidobacteriaceae bacterium]|nr:DUF885 domain-containing protein [Acidobacteriaceae bacterium]
MNRPILIPLLLAANTVLLAADPPQAGDKQWIARSNGFTQMLVDIGNRHSPESASSQGLKEYDERIGQPTKADEDKAITEVRAVLAKLQTQLPDEKDTNVAQDLQIVIRRIELQLREHDFSQSHEVPFINANSY